VVVTPRPDEPAELPEPADLPDPADRGDRADRGDPDERRDPVGVGPWPGPVPQGPGSERYDPELLRDGDRRNVVDRYRYWSVDAVRADLAARAHPVHVAIENWSHDFNIGSVVRTANAMGVAGVHVVGRRRWNRRGAMVTDRYLDVRHHPDAAALAAWAGAEGLPLLGVDNVPGAVPLETRALPRACVLVMGQEGAGLTPEVVAACDAVLAITQFGSTRSINAGAAAAIALHAWVRQHVFDQRVPDRPLP
jgi:tRNA(Leu) C34 or U34 (ribose-2'-O)-methylase TrmL